MKKLFTIILIHLFVNRACAQDTLLTQDLPNAGNMYVMSTGTAFTGMTPASSGPNYIWDYSQLTKSGQTNDTMFATSATNSLLALFFIDIPFNSNRANHATNGQNINLGGTGLTNVFNFFYNSPADYEQAGFGAVASSVPIPVAYTPHDILYKFPLKYNDEDSIAYSYQLDLTSAFGFYYRVKRNRHNLVDGWGSLTTPYGTFDVLRVKSVIVEQDSVYIDTLLHFGTSLPPTTSIEYKWMGKGFGLPLLQINTTGTNTVTQILYQDSTTHVGISEIPAIVSEPQIFPNPASDKLIIHYTLTRSEEVSVYLYAEDGKEIYSETNKLKSSGENFQAINLDAFNISPGIYFIKLKAGNSVFTKQAEISR